VACPVGLGEIGVSPLETLGTTIALEAASSSIRNVDAGGNRPSLALTFQQALKAEQRDHDPEQVDICTARRRTRLRRRWSCRRRC
jgi:hypothetical protein